MDQGRGFPTAMKKGLKKLLRISGLTAGGLVLLVVAAVLLFLFDKPLVKNVAQKYLAKKSGLTLHIGSLDYRLFPLWIKVSSLTATYETPILSMAIRVNRAEARGRFGKLLKGEPAALETVDIDIAVLRLNQKKSSETPVDYQSLVLQARDILSNVRRVSLKFGRIQISIPTLNVGLEEGNLSLAEAETEGTSGLVLEARTFGLSREDRSLGVEGRLHGRGTLALARTTRFDLRLALDEPRFIAAGESGAVKALNIETQGDWTTGRNSLSIARLAFDVPELISLTGSGRADLGSTLSLDLSARGRVENLESLAGVAAPYLPRLGREARIQGRVRMEGRYSLEAGRRFGEGKLDGSLELEAVKLDKTWSGFPFHSQVAGLVNFSGPPADLRASADIRASIGRFRRTDLDIRNASVHLQVNASKRSAVVRDVEGRLEGLALAFSGRRALVLDEVRLKGAARLDIEHRSFRLKALEARLPDFAPLRISGRFDLDPRGARQARLESQGLKISALRRLTAPFVPAGLAGWDLDGALDIKGEAGSFADSKKRWEFSGDLAVSEGKFNDPSSSIAGQGLQPKVRIKGTYDSAQDLVDWQAAGELSRGESLWRDFYISWDKQPVQAEIAGRFHGASGAVDALRARVVFPALGEIHVEGEARLGADSSFRLRAGTGLSLGPLYALYSQTGTGPESRRNVNGDLSGDFEIAKQGGALEVKGRLTVGEASIEEAGSQFAIRGIQADLPVHYLSAPGAGAAGGNPGPVASEKGGIQIGEITTALHRLPPIALTLYSDPNGYRIEPLGLDLLGAPLQFGETSLRIDPATGALHAATSLKLPAFELSRLELDSSRSTVAGLVRADFPVLDITSARITTTGRAEVDIFGGRIVIRDLSVSAPFEAGRAISCDVDLQDIDLKQLTDVVPFGAVTGIIRGQVLGLTITYGQPQSFSLSLESVPRKGVAQTFSLKAVNDLTILSSGGKAATGSSPFWMKFMRGFRYAKIGIVSTLRNDTFTLNGTIHEKGLEYLVKRPGLFGIDVINRMPGTKISFKDMMSRLARIGRSESPEAKK
jgi:hypothetical protein